VKRNSIIPFVAKLKCKGFEFLKTSMYITNNIDFQMYPSLLSIHIISFSLYPSFIMDENYLIDLYNMFS